MNRREAIKWYLNTKPPEQSFALIHPDFDGPRTVVKWKKFWERLGELLRVPERVDIWEDGTLSELVEVLQVAQKNGSFYVTLKGQEGKAPPVQEEFDLEL